MEKQEMNARQTRALALLAGHGAVLLFAFGYYADLAHSVTVPPMMPPLATLFFIFPAAIPALGVGVSYSALAASTENNGRNFRLLERIAVSLFALMLASSIIALFVVFSVFMPFRSHS